MADKTDEIRRKNVNGLRFGWHENALADPEVRKFPYALALAGYVMHRFHTDKGYAEFSHNMASRKLKMPRGSAIRSRDFLVKRGWLRVFERPMNSKGGNAAIRYTQSGGPEDLILDAPQAGVADDTPEEVTST